MAIVTARRFNQSPSEVKALAKGEPVFVTDRGQTALVVMSAEQYDRLTGGSNAYDSLRMDEDAADVDFEPIVDREPGRIADL
ncbi:type II toxin-antitoxin system prevent-host-death family antitoxin [Microlunatus speluncae]|uniref:type II toxin-antitoxin system prevent-host-death family antitoxin n=1 Tax=Microlunatus speluncae TaxID=2594267 RepID=UPI001266256E|nr:type II toxin-antitoxin system prevent-host-death family antitoxin [Microlunatus speluncae]